jgi:hypothetical protein
MSDTTAIVAVLDLAKQVAVVAQSVLADGKVNVTDLIKLSSLWTPAKAALEEMKDIPAEISHIDAAGVQVVLAKLVDVISSIVAIVKPVQVPTVKTV